MMRPAIDPAVGGAGALAPHPAPRPPLPLPEGHENRPLGLALRLCSVTAFAVMALALKIASTQGVDVFWMMFGRSICALPIVILWLIIGPGLRTIRTKRPMAHILRSSLGAIGMVTLIGGLVLLPLAVAVSITFAAPVFATILSAVVLREKVGRYRWTAVGIGFAGVLVVARPWGTEVPLLGAAIALLAAISSAAVSVTVRQIGRTEAVGATVFWFMLSTSVVGALLLPFGHAPHGVAAWACLLLAGLGGGLGQIFMTTSLRHAPVAVLAPLDYLQIPWSILFGWLLWGDRPVGAIYLGAAMIAAGGLWTAWREQRLRRETIASTPLES